MPVASLEPAWLHRQVALVAQEPVLFCRSVRELLYGLSGREPDEEALRAAAHRATRSASSRASLAVSTRPSASAAQLSGGQAAGGSCARARAPALVLLLDEATSALDGESEAVVQASIDAMISSERAA